MTAVAVWAGIVVTDLDRSLGWYEQRLGCAGDDRGDGWASLRFPNRTQVELHEGDPRRPGLAFPSYGGAEGPAVMPGYSVDEPDELTKGLTVARRLPDWIVVVAPDGLRVVLTGREPGPGPGLAAFRFRSPGAGSQREFLAQLGIDGPVADGDGVEAVPVIAGSAQDEVELTDPDGTSLLVVPTPPAP